MTPMKPMKNTFEKSAKDIDPKGTKENSKAEKADDRKEMQAAKTIPAFRRPPGLR